MKNRTTHQWLLPVFAIALLIAGALGIHAAAPVARYTAFAVDMGTPGTGGTGTIEIGVDRWSTTAERNRIMKALKEKGPDKLLDVVSAMPRLGYIRSTGSLGYEVHYAVREPGEDGGEHVVLVTDRPLGFYESWSRARTVDYPFTVVELHIGRDGDGEGKLSLATRITADRHGDNVVLENYSSQPVMLTRVRRAN